MYTLQQLLNPLVLQDGGSWLISCPAQPVAAEESTFEMAVESIISQLREYSFNWKAMTDSEAQTDERVARILRSATDEALRAVLMSVRPHSAATAT